MPNDEVLKISRRKLCLTFIDELYTTEAVSNITEDDHMKVPVERVRDWFHDMGVIFGRAVKKVIEEMADEEDV